jgi:arabinogalactan oligomer/maltooligosaccharide transport system permease protein
VRRQGWAYAYLAPAMIAMAVLVFIPFAVGAVMSLYHHESGHWTFIGLSNFGDILASKQQPLFAPLSFYFTLVVTALWTVANVTLHVLVGVTLALLLRDPMLKLRGVYRMLLIVPWAVPNYITALIWKGMFHRQFGAVNALLAYVGIAPVSWFSRFWTAFTANLTTNVWLGFPFMMVVTLGALGRIPRELEEAAALDGASRWQRLRHVTLPLLWPAMLPSVLLGAIWTFNMFNIVFLVSGGEPDGATEILVTQAYRWAFTRGHVYGYAAAYAVLILVVLAAQTALARRLEEREAT